VDAALAGQPLSGAIPTALAAALQRSPTTAAWLGVEALGVPIELDGARWRSDRSNGPRSKSTSLTLQAADPPAVWSCGLCFTLVQSAGL